MKEYTDRVKILSEAMAESSSSTLFSMVERELNTRLTAVIGGKKVYGGELYTSRIKIEGIVLCSEYNVLRANYNYLVLALRIINEKIKLERMTSLYKSVVDSALDGLTYNELEGVYGVLSELEGSSGVVVTSSVSKNTGIARSAVINGLRKLECAGILEMHSKGAQGTALRILYRDIISAVRMKRGDNHERDKALPQTLHTK